MMRDVQHWQRLTMRGAFKAEAAGHAVLQRIANAVNLPDYRILQHNCRYSARCQGYA